MALKNKPFVKKDTIKRKGQNGLKMPFLKAQ